MCEQQTVVLISNEPTFRWTISRLLERHGMVVEAHDRSAAAIDYVRDVRPLAVILETSYGSALTAVSLVERLRSDIDTRYLPIIVCSPDDRFVVAYGEYMRSEGCVVTGRPFDDGRFIDLVEHVVARNALDSREFTTATSLDA